jgi:hypothetical protein
MSTNLPSLELTSQEREIIYEVTRAREIMEVLNTPGWLHIQDLMDSKISTLEDFHLNAVRLTPEALWAQHVAVQYVRDFVKALKAQLATTGDFLRDPAAIQAMIAQTGRPQEAELEGELPNPLNPMPSEG